MTDRKVEQSKGCAALVSKNFLSIPLKISFHLKIKVLATAWNSQSNKPFLTLELSQYCKSSLSLPAATVADSCLSYQPKQCRRAAPRAWQLILPSKPLIAFWNSLWRDCQMTGRGSILDSNLKSAAWPTSWKRFYSLRHHSINYLEYEFFFQVFVVSCKKWHENFSCPNSGLRGVHQFAGGLMHSKKKDVLRQIQELSCLIYSLRVCCKLWSSNSGRARQHRNKLENV